MERLSVHLTEYQYIFHNRTKVFFDKAKKYSQGIVHCQMRNIERISEGFGVDYYQRQHFFTESNWDTGEVINKVAMDVSTALPKRIKLCGYLFKLVNP